jgi:hypothetical protein
MVVIYEKGEYTESDKLTAVWEMKEIVFNKTKRMDAKDYFPYINNTAKNLSAKTRVKPPANSVRTGKKRVA